jgi:hypothetical protein
LVPADHVERSSRVSRDTITDVSLLEALDRAVARIVRGIAGVVERRPDELDGVLSDLSSGFEVLAKLTLIEAVRNQTGKPLAEKAIKRTYGHDLERLTDAIAEEVRSVPQYSTREVAKADLEFLSTNPVFRSQLVVLSHYATGGRFEGVASQSRPGGTTPDEDPIRQWQDMETEQWLAQSRDGIDHGRAVELGRAGLAAPLRHYAGAIALMWSLGGLGERASTSFAPTLWLLRQMHPL